MMSTTANQFKPLIVLLGSTAVGKTALSLRLCEQAQGEVVNADSRQIYRDMDIGTAKPTPAEQATVPHHLIDIRNPDEPITLAEFQAMAYAAINAVHRRGNIPFLVGGSPLYVRAVVEGLRIPAAPPDPTLRADLEAELADKGVESLAARLAAIDPATAAQTDLRNPRRVLRALEIYLLTGQSKVALEGTDPPPYIILRIGLQRSRAALYSRIDARVDAMVAGGLVEETAQLLAAGYAPTLPAMTSLGYREITSYLQGILPLSDAVERIKTETHRYVRHQETWLRKFQDIHWFDLEQQQLSAVEAYVAEWLVTQGQSDG